MTEKRYKVNIDHHKTSRNYVNGILDCETNVLLDNYTAINNRLNEQHETITEQASQIDFLKDENHHMRTVLEENKQLKEELEQCKAVIDKRWSEYLKEKELDV